MANKNAPLMLLLLLASAVFAAAQDAPVLEFALVRPNPVEGAREMASTKRDGTEEMLWVDRQPIITDADVAYAHRSIDQDGNPNVVVSLTSSGANKIYETTVSHTGERMAIIVNGKFVTAPVINEPFGSTFVINGRFSPEEAKQLALQIGGGKEVPKPVVSPFRGPHGIPYYHDPFYTWPYMLVSFLFFL